MKGKTDRANWKEKTTKELSAIFQAGNEQNLMCDHGNGVKRTDTGPICEIKLTRLGHRLDVKDKEGT